MRQTLLFYIGLALVSIRCVFASLLRTDSLQQSEGYEAPPDVVVAGEYSAAYSDSNGWNLADFWRQSVERGQHTPVPRLRLEGGATVTWPLLLVIGVQKGGTTNLRFNLLQHPQLSGARREVHFFDERFSFVAELGMNGTTPLPANVAAQLLIKYSKTLAKKNKRRGGRGAIGCGGGGGINRASDGSGGSDGGSDDGSDRGGKSDHGCFAIDVSPRYVFHPAVPYRVRALLPHVRIVVLLRDPVARYFSELSMYICRGYGVRHYHLAGMVPRYLEAARKAYAPYDELCRGPAAAAADLWACKVNATEFEPLARGLYADQLERWFSLFPRSQIVVLDSNELFANFTGVLDRVTAFAGLPPFPYRYDPSHQSPDIMCRPGRKAAAAARQAEMTAAGDEALLREYYAPHNERLFRLIGRDLGWNSKRDVAAAAAASTKAVSRAVASATAEAQAAVAAAGRAFADAAAELETALAAATPVLERAAVVQEEAATATAAAVGPADAGDVDGA